MGLRGLVGFRFRVSGFEGLVGFRFRVLGLGF